MKATTTATTTARRSPQQQVDYTLDVYAMAPFALRKLPTAMRHCAALKGAHLLLFYTWHATLLLCSLLVVVVVVAAVVEMVVPSHCACPSCVPGEWRGPTAGGCPNHDTHADNPTWSLELRAPTDVLFELSARTRADAAPPLGARYISAIYLSHISRLYISVIYLGYVSRLYMCVFRYHAGAAEVFGCECERMDVGQVPPGTLHPFYKLINFNY